MTKFKIVLAAALVVGLGSAAGAMTGTHSSLERETACPALNHQYGADIGGVPSSAYATLECVAAPKHRVLRFTVDEKATFQRAVGGLN